MSRKSFDSLHSDRCFFFAQQAVEVDEISELKHSFSKKRPFLSGSSRRFKRIALAEIHNFCDKLTPPNFSPSQKLQSFSADNENQTTTCCCQRIQDDETSESCQKLLNRFINLEGKDGVLPKENYFETVQKRKDGHLTRTMVAKWFFQTVSTLKLSNVSAFLAINYFDRFLSKVKVKIQLIPVLSQTCLFVAAKFWECQPPTAVQLLQCYKAGCGNEISMLLKFEILLLQVLKWELNIPSAYDIMNVCLEYIQITYHSCASDAIKLIQHCTTEYRMLRFTPSTLAICSLATCLQRIERNTSLSEPEKSDEAPCKRCLRARLSKLSQLFSVTPDDLYHFEDILKTSSIDGFRPFVKMASVESFEDEQVVASPTSIMETEKSFSTQKMKIQQIKCRSSK
eukprot:jgi/Galph1/4544/GphlegSOOS_G3142.1